jgi:hypothetical protein
MGKLFGKQQSFIKKIMSGGKKKKLNLPYSDSRGGEKEKMSKNRNFDPRKTQMGAQADYPSGKQANNGSQKDIETCPKCQYPLRTKPDSSSPCPNCGFAGSGTKTVFDSGKTITISSLNQDSGELQEFRFKLVKEDDNSEIEIQSPDEPEVILNRSHLDPANSTISSEQHLVMKFKNRRIYVEDVSSNGSSFLQAKIKVVIGNGTRLVIGNKIYVFNQSGVIAQGDSPNKTRKFGEFDLKVGQPLSGFSLTEEISGKRLLFDKTHIVLNRSVLDPGNNSISSSKHTEFELSNGQWYIRDLSSNQSTFVQLRGEQLLENKIRIILGNKIFRFENV